MSSYDNPNGNDFNDNDGFDPETHVDVLRTAFIMDDGTIDFEKLQSVWQGNQAGVENGYQQVQIYHKNGDPIYFKARLNVVVDLLDQWYEVRQAMSSGGELPEDVDPIWVAVTGAFCSSVDLRDVHGVQARPAGNYRGNRRQNNGGQRRQQYSNANYR